jgi:DNA (cytosine-5)-methyltransferase 3A
MNVLSLFDGMSCGQIALDQLDINVDNYYAAEIDKWAMQVAKKNYPNMKHLGDVTELKGDDLPKIDLLIGGSPCQGFSFAGKQLNFDDPRSALFFEFVRLLKETKPTYFLLENVRMKQEFQDVISDHLGVKPIMINSALMSAQNRVRLYWTNIPNVTQPEDKGIVLKDVLEGGVSVKGAAKRNQVTKRGIEAQLNIRKDDKSNCVVASWPHKLNGCVEYRPCELKEFNKDSTCHHAATATDIKGNESIKRVYADSGKSPTITTMGGGHREPKVLCGRIVGRKINPETGKRDDYNPDIKAVQRLEPRLDEKCGTLTTVQKDNVLIIKEATKKGYTEIQDGDCFDATFPTSKTRRGRNMKDKSNCLTAANYEYMRYEHPTYRKLTPLECERLQTVPDDYTACVSNTQRYKMLGNGWTVDVIKHIFKGMK